MQKEIEVKLKFNDKESILLMIKNLGGKFVEKYELEDTYFSLEHTDMKNAHDLVRVRRKGDKSEITLKGKCIDDKGIWERVEITSQIGDAENVCKILSFLKFNEVLKNRSLREYWRVKDAEIVFVKLLFPVELEFMEIESKSKQEIEDLMKHLAGYTELIGEDYFKKIDESKKK